MVNRLNFEPFDTSVTDMDAFVKNFHRIFQYLTREYLLSEIENVVLDYPGEIKNSKISSKTKRFTF